MKRLLALLLTLLCVFAFVGCGGKNPPPDPGPDPDPDPNPGPVVETLDLSEINAAIANTAPSTAVITTSLNSDYGKLEGCFTVTYNADGSSVIAYSYEQFNEVSAENSGKPMKETVSGNVTVDKNGNVSGGVGENVVALSAIAFALDVDKLENEKIEGGVFSATVLAANTASVLGTDIGYDTLVVMTTSGGKVTSVALSYTLPVGKASISCTYSY